MAAWIRLIGAVVGGLIAAGATWLNSGLQFRYQQERERRKLLLTKMQELYEVTSEFKQSYTISMSSHLLCLVERRSATAEDSTPPVPVERLQMLVCLYAPKLESNLDLLLRRRQEFSDAPFSFWLQSGNELRACGRAKR